MPTAHLATLVQFSTLVPLLHERVVDPVVKQAVHSRSDESVGAAVTCWPGLHVVTALHTRSALPVGAADVYWPDGQVALCV